MITLFLETIDGDLPNLEDGKTVGGWPCQRFPSDWAIRVQSLIDEYATKRTTHTLCAKPDRAKGQTTQLLTYLKRCVKDAQSLTGRDVGRIRVMLASYIAKWGQPSSDKWQAYRDRQKEQTASPTHQMIAQAIAARSD